MLTGVAYHGEGKLGDAAKLSQRETATRPTPAVRDEASRPRRSARMWRRYAREELR